ncbi:MAG: DUF3332 domain-containing protein [Muribaculaceae bacterium]|nr:DUF3332 domain-containing protein [Muribaculaceae bacterium]
MKKRYLSVAIISLVLSSMTLSSCIGSFRLTNSVLKWNNQVGSKFLNELVFFAFWVLPVYEVTSLADILVINSIEFWSGRNPLSASVKVIDTDDGRYIVKCDGKGYTITNQDTSQSYRLDFVEEDQTWTATIDNRTYPLMTFIDESHVKMIAPGGDYRVVELSEESVMAYSQDVVRYNDVKNSLASL